MDEDVAVRDQESVEMGPLLDSLGLLLRLSQLQSFGAFFRDMEEVGLRPGEISVLVLIGQNPGIRQGIVARTLRVKRAHMAKMMAGMERDGIVSRRAPEDDRRALELRLTEAGRARLDAVMPVFLEHEARRPATLTRAEEATLKRLLRKYLALPDPEVRP
ncbi:MarR family winged helix-turn-helix transcriptional regulator [Histidinibacterium aquaticum]|uniref:MarR family transcriptional regulator n=1 Tax=Histidinibacterium aquaticum TaxID=2613962 RepID=A0A5J5GIA9_9RHOB|nr:MarR family transcriptional regulator [Histidinibacterium aquaticum]KAA9007857.1 MarR family transcriptional regulator [Histidinibacterium aquaticum]